jgi:hypothetical protein
MADLIGDDTLGAFFAHPEAPASPGRQLIDRVFAPPFDKVLRQLYKRDRKCGGFYHPTNERIPDVLGIGMAAAFLGLLRDPRTREDFLRLNGVSPENVRCDESLARALALAWMIGNLAKWRDAEVNKRLDQFRHERRRAQTLHELGEDYEEDARRHDWKALAHLNEAVDEYRAATRSVGTIVRYIGWSLEEDFSLRAPRLVAELVTNIVGLRPKMTERQARYLCGWEQRSPMKNRTPENCTSGSV